MITFDALSVNAVGIQATTGVASAVTAIPATASGRAPKHVYIQATGLAYIKPGLVGSACTVNDILITVNNPIVLDVAGFTHIAHIQEAAAAKVNITPLES